MIVVVETNFLIELALEQDDVSHCAHILELAESRDIELVMPIFCVAEAYQSVGEKNRRRNALAGEIDRELLQLKRTQSVRSLVSAHLEDKGRQLRELLSVCDGLQRNRIHDTLLRVLAIGRTIPFDANVLRRSAECSVAYTLKKMGDAAVCASVLEFLDRERPREALFVERDREDFASPDLEDALIERSCSIEFQFGKAAGVLHRRLAKIA